MKLPRDLRDLVGWSVFSVWTNRRAALTGRFPYPEAGGRFVWISVVFDALDRVPPVRPAGGGPCFVQELTY